MDTLLKTNLELLNSQINDQKNSLHTDRMDISFGELINMYRDGELEINPAFQRNFKWDKEQRTRFIESLILGIPIPPIFVAESPVGEGNRLWEVVDGLQRLSTVLSFFGYLKSEKEEIQNKNNWKLTQGDRLSALKGLGCDDLSQGIRFNIKRATCRVEVIRWNGNYDMRFELFNRLNTGGTTLKPQEIRNAIYRDISPKFNIFLEKLAKNEDFQNLIALPEKEKNEFYDQQLILRFLFLHNNYGKVDNEKGIEQQLNSFMRESLENKNFDYKKQEDIFHDTIKILAPLGKEIFRHKDGKFASAFYDTIVFGVSKNMDFYANIDPIKLNAKIEMVKNNHKNLNRNGGKNQIQRVKKRIKFANEIFGKI